MINQNPAWPAFVERMAQGDETAMEAFYDETCRIAYAFALRMLREGADAEEVVLDAYAQFWRSAARYDPGRCTPLGWLITMVRSRAIDRLRSRQASPRMVEEPSPALHAERPATDQVLIMQDALTRLPAKERRTIEFAFFDGFTHPEIAQILGEPLGTVKSRIRRTLGMLRGILEQAPGDQLLTMPR